MAISHPDLLNPFSYLGSVLQHVPVSHLVQKGRVERWGHLTVFTERGVRTFQFSFLFFFSNMFRIGIYFGEYLALDLPERPCLSEDQVEAAGGRVDISR